MLMCELKWAVPRTSLSCQVFRLPPDEEMSFRWCQWDVYRGRRNRRLRKRRRSSSSTHLWVLDDSHGLSWQVLSQFTHFTTLPVPCTVQVPGWFCSMCPLLVDVVTTPSGSKSIFYRLWPIKMIYLQGTFIMLFHHTIDVLPGSGFFSQNTKTF